jgi:hypothetical protein
MTGRGGVKGLIGRGRGRGSGRAISASSRERSPRGESFNKHYPREAVSEGFNHCPALLSAAIRRHQPLAAKSTHYRSKIT